MQPQPQVLLNRIRLRQETFDLLCRSHGLDTLQAKAAAIGVQHSTVSRIVRGEVAPSPHFMSGAALAFGVGLDDLFEIMPPTDAAA